jgi:hypothetical protein
VEGTERAFFIRGKIYQLWDPMNHEMILTEPVGNHPAALFQEIQARFFLTP